MPLAPYALPTRYEDFLVGAVVLHEQRRVVTETDNLLFSRLSGHEHPSLFAYAQEQRGPVPVLPFLVLAICGGVAVRATSQEAIANLGWEYIRFPNQAYVGDLLRAISHVADKRLSRRDPARGIVTIITYGVRQDEAIVLEAKRSFLVPAGSSAVEPKVNQ